MNMPQHLWVVLRTCDRVSLSSDRIVDKPSCVTHCLKSLVTSLTNNTVLPWSLKIIDDCSSTETRDHISRLASMADITWLEPRQDQDLNTRQRSRYSVAQAYDWIYQRPHHDLIYIVEDDYLHYPNSIDIMLRAWQFFSAWIVGKDIGIYPQDFQQLHASPFNNFNDTYVRPCVTMIGPDRYYRTTWYSQETFLLQASVFHKYRAGFDSLLTIGDDPGLWEGNTISEVWQHPEVSMLMPMPTIALHVSQQRDIPFYCGDFDDLWQKNQPS